MRDYRQIIVLTYTFDCSPRFRTRNSLSTCGDLTKMGVIPVDRILSHNSNLNSTSLSLCNPPLLEKQSSATAFVLD